MALLDELYSVAFRKKQYERIEELRVGLDDFMDDHDCRRTDQGHGLKENGYKIPGQAPLSK
jgi:hypothetical protein